MSSLQARQNKLLVSLEAMRDLLLDGLDAIPSSLETLFP